MYMPELSKHELETLWEAGVPLDTAYAEFAALFDRFAHTPLSTHPAKDPAVRSTKS